MEGCFLVVSFMWNKEQARFRASNCKMAVYDLASLMIRKSFASAK